MRTRTLEDTDPSLGLGRLLLVYLAIIFGILEKGLLEFFAAGPGHRVADFFAWERIIPAMVISVVIFPPVYRTVMTDRKKEMLPFLIELATVFSLGVGYKSIFDAVIQ